MAPELASTGPAGYDVGHRFQRGTCVIMSPDMAKMDPTAADMAVAVWNGNVRDARRHAHQ